jgi:hypothetical protein
VTAPVVPEVVVTPVIIFIAPEAAAVVAALFKAISVVPVAPLKRVAMTVPSTVTGVLNSLAIS